MLNDLQLEKEFKELEKQKNNPKKSLQIIRGIKKKNKRYFYDIFLVAVLAPISALLASFAIIRTQSLSKYKEIVLIALYIVAFGSAPYIYYRRMKNFFRKFMLHPSMNVAGKLVFLYFFSIPYLLILLAISVAITSPILFFLFLVFNFPVKPIPHIGYLFAIAPVFFIVIIIVSTRIEWSLNRINIKKLIIQIPIALKKEFRNILSLLSGVYVFILPILTFTGIIRIEQLPLFEILIIIITPGFMVGFSFLWIYEDIRLNTSFVNLELKWLLRTGQRVKALYQCNELFELANLIGDKELNQLAKSYLSRLN